MARVFGSVLDEARGPLAGHTITLETESIRGERAHIGCGVTDGHGCYALDYELNCDASRLRVTLAGPSDHVLQRRTFASMSTEQRVDFRVGARLDSPVPLFAGVARELDKALAADDVELIDLDTAGMARAALSAGVHPAHAAALRRAMQSSSVSGIATETFVGLGAGQLSFDAAAVMRHSGPARRRAVEGAIASGVLTTAQADVAREGLDVLDAMALSAALEVGADVATPGLALSLAGIEQDGEALLSRWRDHQGTAAAFWREVDLEPPVKAKLQFALRLATLCRGHVPLIERLFNSNDSLSSLSSLTAAEWTTLTKETGAPAHLKRAGLEEVYPTAIFEDVEDAMPTSMLSARSAWFESGEALAKFLGGNATYDLTGVPLREYLRAHPDALAAAGEADAQEAVSRELPILERLYRISPRGQRFETMRALRDAGLVSATQIQQLGSTRFISMMRGSLGEAPTSAVYRSARSLSAAAVTLQMRHAASAPNPSFAVLPLRDAGVDDASEGVEWASLFGGRTFCACDGCQSAHGPAAYLADLLFWLRGRAEGGDHLATLRGRRPDIEQLRLSCKNANTPLPSIDLLLERLEAEVAPEGALALQTTLDEAELLARPEHIHSAAYERLAEPTGYPFEAPYVWWLDQARSFLSALGVERAALLIGLAEGDVAASLTRPEVAAEVLGMNRASWTLSSGERTASPAEQWGIGAAPAPSSTATLRSVPVFLQQAGVRSDEAPLSYAALEDIVRSGFVQSAGVLWIWFPNRVCDITDAVLVSEDFDAHLDRIAALLRLSWELGWSIQETDRAIEVFRESAGSAPLTSTDVSARLLLDLGSVRWLEGALELSPQELLGFWGPLDTRRWHARIEDGVPAGHTAPSASDEGMGRRPRLDSANAGRDDAERSVFQNMVGSLDEARLFALRDDGSELTDTSLRVADHVDPVASVLGAEPMELAPLLAALGTTARITLPNLSRLWRQVRLARALRLDAVAFVRWQTWTGIEPFASPSDAIRFVVEVQRQNTIRLGDDAMRVLLGTTASRDLSALELPSALEAMLALSDEHRNQSAASAEERERAIVRRVAALLDLDVALLDGLLALPIDGTPVREALLDTAARLDASRAADPEGSTSPSSIARLVDTRIWELVALSGWMARVFDLRVEDLRWLIGASPSVRGFDFEAIVLAPALADRYAAWAALREAARLRGVAGGARLFDLWGELTSGAMSAPELRAALAERTGWSEEDLRAAIDDAFGGPLGGTGPEDWAQPSRFARLTGWMELATRLRVAAEPLGRWGALVWDDATTNDPVDAYRTHASELEQALRATWGQERWLKEMPSVREGLRERARAALVSRLVGDSAYPSASPDALGASLLMDVQMGACARTSRLKDATRTVQSFVQRVLLGQEPPLSLSEGEAKEWLWRKRFRVWEANRKVFLYPENWIRPELLRERTPLLDALSSALSQGDLDEDTVESAYRSYLRDLASVSKLEALCVLNEERLVGKDVFHVFARSRGLPRTYWHRRWVDESRWTPWTKVAHAEGEHLIPVVYQRRVMLFWLNIGENAQPPGAVPLPALGGFAVSPPKLFQIHLTSSEWRDGAWSAPTRSDAYIGLDSNGTRRPHGVVLSDLEATGSVSGGLDSFIVEPRSTLQASARVDGHDLLIEVYKAIESDLPIPLARFRVSAVDGRVRSEIGPFLTRVTHGPADATHLALLGQAQRLTGTGSLTLPFPDEAASSGSEWQPILVSESAPQTPITVTPVERVEFDPRDPFVFDDDSGAYWVTLDTVRDFWLGSARFDPGEYRKDRLSIHPSVREGLEARFALTSPRTPLFKDSPGEGVAAFIPEGALRGAVAAGAKITDVIGTAVSGEAPTQSVRMVVTVWTADGTAVEAAESGSSSRTDLEIVANLALIIPGLLISPPASREGPYRLIDRIARYRFHSFFHPHVGLMRETLNRLGVLGLLDPPAGERLAGQDPTPESTLQSRYRLPGVSAPFPTDDLDFEVDGAYAQYNWELFFHAPFLIAARLHEAGRHMDALRWLHVIFDPTRPARAGADAPEVARSFWRFRPFREQFADGARPPKNIQQLLALLSNDASDRDAVEEAERLLSQIAQWRRNPFDPHAIARTRPQAYMAAVVMRYLDVILDRGDQLFGVSTLESVAEAAELFLLAARLLGPRPEPIEVGDPEPSTFADLLRDFDAGLGPVERAEEIVEAWEVADDAYPDEGDSLATLLYFCTPANPQLTTRYWDRVADRLFKLRHCLDLEGRRRDLALYEPPIDPELLVRAAAAGVDLQTLLADVSASEVPHRRYLAMAEVAAGLASAAQALGQGLLSAIEKRDADQLNALRAQHERAFHEDTLEARREQLAEAEEQAAALRLSRETVEIRRRFYEDKPRTNARENAQKRGASIAKGAHIAATASYATGSALGLIPQFELGAAGGGGTPVATTTFGGQQLASLANGIGQLNANIAAFEDRQGRMALTEAGYDRRKEGWDLQADLANKELEAFVARIAASDIRVALARAAVATAQTRKTQLEEIRTVLERRFGREELFDWLASQLSGLHFQSYQLAYEFAKKAERAWRYELGRSDTDFIRFGYWDSRQKGLLAAERLGHDLRRMQVAYIEENRRRLEVDQTFSLRDVDPVALVRLQETGETSFSLPEALFDLYYPGQYRRRIRAVRFTIPAVVPPGANVPALFSLSGHRIRHAPTLDADSLIEGGFGTPPVPLSATSSAQRDGGVLELSFNAPRLLPFEGAGAVSDWTVTLPKAVRPFDYRQIQDLLLHVAYDAEYSEILRTSLETAPAPVLSNLFTTSPPRRRVISLRQEHGGTLRQLVQGPVGTPVRFAVAADTLPAYLRQVGVSVANPVLVVRAAAAGGLALSLNGTALTSFGPWLEVPLLSVDASGALGSLLATHTLAVDDWGSVDPSDPHLDILLVVDFLAP